MTRLAAIPNETSASRRDLERPCRAIRLATTADETLAKVRFILTTITQLVDNNVK